MKLKTSVILTGFLLLFVANVCMMFIFPFGVRGEGFKNKMAGFKNQAKNSGFKDKKEGFKNKNSGFKDKKEGFANVFSPGGAKDAYEPIGAYDNVVVPTDNNISSWRYTAPNEPLMGPEFQPGPDSLFLFKNNQCKPECCGASFSCDGGCVCTSPEQRQYIASRGGNRTSPEDSA